MFHLNEGIGNTRHSDGVKQVGIETGRKKAGGSPLSFFGSTVRSSCRSKGTIDSRWSCWFPCHFLMLVS